MERLIINPLTQQGIVVNDCGSGAGGFKPDNTCAKGGGGSEGESSIETAKVPKNAEESNKLYRLLQSKAESKGVKFIYKSTNPYGRGFKPIISDSKARKQNIETLQAALVQGINEVSLYVG